MSFSVPSCLKPWLRQEEGGFRDWRAMVVIAALLAFIWSALIPPFKSPDEPDHLRRAYLLTQGQWLLYSQPCAEEGYRCKNGKTASGGELDRGLKDYLAVRDRINAAQQTVNHRDEEQAEGFRWAHENAFDISPGTGYYFPLVYAPQAAGLALSKALGLRLETSYYVARFFSLSATFLVLALAFSIWTPQPITLALLLLPMTLYQVVSTSLDGFSTALAVLALSCFLRIMDPARPGRGLALFSVMAASLFLVATSRAHMLPMLLVLYVAAWRLRNPGAWVGALVVTAAVLGWMAVALPSSVDLRLERTHSTGEILAHYLQSPSDLVGVFWRTFSDPGLMNSYFKSFIGQFFALFLSPHVYVVIAAMLAAIHLSSLWKSPLELRSTVLARSTLLLIGIVSCFLGFLAMLLTWTPHPADTIEGVQGRYFLVPVMLILSAVGPWRVVSETTRKLGAGLLALLFGIGFFAGTVRMLDGFYTPWIAISKEASVGEKVVSKLLTPEQKIDLRFDSLVAASGEQPVRRIGVKLATYQQQLSGEATLSYRTESGKTESRTVPLARVRDNEYLYIDLPPDRYVAGELSVKSGPGGLSVWEYHLRETAEAASLAESPPWQSCVILELEDGTRQATTGCK